MNPSSINWFAVIVAALAFYALGAVWYSLLFRKLWIRESKVSEDAAKNANMVMIFSLTLLFSLIMVTNLAFMLNSPGIGAAEGALYGFLTGFGFVAAAMALTALYEMKSITYILINGGYMICGFTLSGFILGVWK